MPASSGLNLGNSGQKWDAAIRNLTADSLLSGSVNVAGAGSLRLASADTIAFRNAANTADITLSKTQALSGTVPADAMQWSGGGIIADCFVTDNANPANSGVFRLAAGDQVVSRNQANSGDIALVYKDTDDSTIVGAAQGSKSTIFCSASATPATGGVVRMANTETVSWRNAGNSGNITLTGDSSDRIASNAPNGMLLSGAAPSVVLGSPIVTQPMLKAFAGSPPALESRLGDDSGFADFHCNNLAVTMDAQVGGKLTSYNGITTGGVGQSVIVAYVELASSALAIGTTTMYTTTTGGLYRLAYHFLVTAAGNAVNLAGVLGWTDRTTTAHTVTTANIACNVLGANSCVITQASNLVFTAGVNTPITYATTLSGAIGAGAYRTVIVLEYLGID